ncbi:MAG: NRDE family protein [Bacteroidia bacterium]|nr:NRDE family protein [Bacteroidia bacterium]MDW8347901.1 NRDE family protein [Bacteroidia bacterium]
MCTLAFEYQKGKLTIGFNRDEVSDRNLAYSPQHIQKNNIHILAPIDPVGSGTWIGVNQFGRVACLMNHTHYKNQYNLVYFHSRGQLVLDILSLVHQQPFFYVQSQAKDFAPFHLFVFDGETAFRVTWDSFELHFYTILHGSYSFSSATLYSVQVSQERNRIWQNTKLNSIKEYETFLSTCRIQNYVNSLGKEVNTVSFTLLSRDDKQSVIEYQPLYPEVGKKVTQYLPIF